MVNFDNKKLLRNISKAFIVNPAAEKEKRLKVQSNSVDKERESKDECSATETSKEISNEAQPKQQPQVSNAVEKVSQSPRISKAKPPPEFVTFDKLLAKRRDKIGVVAATKEYSKMRNVPQEFQSVFLRNALNDEPNYVYFNVKGAVPNLHPTTLTNSVKDYVDLHISQDSVTLESLKKEYGSAVSAVNDLDSNRQLVERKGAKLIKRKQRLPEPQTLAEKKERKELVKEIKSLKSQLNSLLSQLESATENRDSINWQIKYTGLSSKVLHQIRFASKDGRILTVAPFASWENDSPDIDCRAYLSKVWNGVSIPLTGGSGASLKLVYRPSSAKGILLAKFVFPYAEEGNWTKIVQSGFLDSSDFIFDSTEAQPVYPRKSKIPGLDALYYVYLAFTLGSDQLPAKTSENYPDVKLTILSSVHACGNCASVSHQSSKCRTVSKKSKKL